MARTAVNPKVLTTPSPAGLTLKKVLAADSKTWKAGEFGALSSGTVQPVASASATASYCIFAEDQTTSTSTSYVWVYLLEDGTELEMYVYNNNQVYAIATSNIGTRYGVQTVSNITYLDLNQTTGQFQVIELASAYMPERSAYDGGLNGTTGTTAGLCKVKFRKNVS